MKPIVSFSLFGTEPKYYVGAEKNIIEIKTLEQINEHFLNYDIIIYNNNVYFITENITKMYSLIEIIESYKMIYFKNNGELNVISNLSQLRNMPEEKYRVALFK